MSIEVRIGNTIHEIPEVGNHKWGEITTDVLLSLVKALQDVVGPEDIITKEALLSNGVITPTPINGFKFDSSIVQSASATGVVVRTFPPELSMEPKKDTFIIEASSYQGSFDYSIRYIGNNAGVKLSARDDGQFEYTSENDPLTTSIFIKFKGSAIVDDTVE